MKGFLPTGNPVLILWKMLKFRVSCLKVNSYNFFVSEQNFMKFCGNVLTIENLFPMKNEVHIYSITVDIVNNVENNPWIWHLIWGFFPITFLFLKLWGSNFVILKFLLVLIFSQNFMWIWGHLLCFSACFFDWRNTFFDQNGLNFSRILSPFLTNRKWRKFRKNFWPIR